MIDEHRIWIDGDEVTFEIATSGQAMSVASVEPDIGRPYLGVTVRAGNRLVWSGILPAGVDATKRITEQFSDTELEQLYRHASGVR